MTETGELQAIWCCWYQSRGGSGNSSVTAGVSSEDGGSMGKLMMVASVAVGVGCRAAIAGTSKSLGASDIVTTVAEEASFSEI